MFYLHQILFAVYPVVFLYAENVDAVIFADVVPALIAVLGGTATLFICGRFLFRNGEKAALAVTLAIILFFSYGSIFEPSPGAYWIKHRYLLSLWALLYISGMYSLFRTKRTFTSLTRALNMASVVLVAYSLGAIAMYNVEVLSNGDVAQDVRPLLDIQASQVRDDQPDVYYIILDAYASNTVLQREIGFDNSEFLAYLSKKGFYVVSDANSNYSATHLSLPSSLNMDYIHNLATKPNIISAETVDIRGLVEDNAVQKFLKQRGYTFIHFGSNWQTTYHNRFADENFMQGYFSEFLLILYKKTAFYPIGKKFDVFNDRRLQYDGILSHFENLRDIPKRPGPLFVFAHLMVPTHPMSLGRTALLYNRSKNNRKKKKHTVTNLSSRTRK